MLWTNKHEGRRLAIDPWKVDAVLLDSLFNVSAVQVILSGKAITLMKGDTREAEALFDDLCQAMERAKRRLP